MTYSKADLQRDAGIPHEPTDLTYDCRMAISGEGPRAHEWADKPHRLVYDLCREVERMQELIDACEDMMEFVIFAKDEPPVSPEGSQGETMTEVKLCPSCREPLNYPSGDGCAAMTKHNSEVNYLDVIDIQDQEDGSCIITFEVNKKATIGMATLGIRFALYCAAVNTTTEEVLKTMLEKAKQPNE